MMQLLPLVLASLLACAHGFVVAAPRTAGVAKLRISTATMGESKLLRELDAELSTIAKRNLEIPAEMAKLQDELANLNSREAEIGALLSFLQGRNSVAGTTTDLDELITAGTFTLQRGAPVQVIEEMIYKLRVEAVAAGRLADVESVVRQLESKAQTKRDWPMADRYRTTGGGTLDADTATAVRTMGARGVDALTISKMLNVPETQVRLYIN